MFISFVTAADSNISAMGGISSTGISPDSPEPSLMSKIVWGASVGIIAWAMISFAKIDGIKMLSNLGGVPAIILELFVVFALMKVARSPEKYDVTITTETSEEQKKVI